MPYEAWRLAGLVDRYAEITERDTNDVTLDELTDLTNAGYIKQALIARSAAFELREEEYPVEDSFEDDDETDERRIKEIVRELATTPDRLERAAKATQFAESLGLPYKSVTLELLRKAEQCD